MDSKKGPWDESEDDFLLTYCSIGPNFIASHDLGRGGNAGSNRMKKLIETGAAKQYATAMHHLNLYRMMCGRHRAAFDLEVLQDQSDYWAEKAQEWDATQ